MLKNLHTNSWKRRDLVSTHPTYNRLTALLEGVWPHLLSIDWAEYADNYEPVVFDGDMAVAKSTGVLAHFYYRPILGIYTQSFGFLPKPERSAHVVLKKVEALLRNPNQQASLEMRNPEHMLFAGAVRSSVVSHLIYAITGLPEIGDHLYVSVALQRSGQLSDADYAVLTDPNTPHMTSAREHVGMSELQFKALKRTIESVVDDFYELRRS